MLRTCGFYDYSWWVWRCLIILNAEVYTATGSSAYRMVGGIADRHTVLARSELRISTV